MAQRSIRVPPESDLAAIIRQAHESGRPITVDTGDGVYRIVVSGPAPARPSADQVARSRAAIRQAIGSWKGIDAEAFKSYITERRRIGNRPSMPW